MKSENQQPLLGSQNSSTGRRCRSVALSFVAVGLILFAGVSYRKQQFENLVHMTEPEVRLAEPADDKTIPPPYKESGVAEKTDGGGNPDNYVGELSWGLKMACQEIPGGVVSKRCKEFYDYAVDDFMHLIKIADVHVCDRGDINAQCPSTFLPQPCLRYCTHNLKDCVWHQAQGYWKFLTAELSTISLFLTEGATHYIFEALSGGTKDTIKLINDWKKAKVAMDEAMKASTRNAALVKLEQMGWQVARNVITNIGKNYEEKAQDFFTGNEDADGPMVSFLGAYWNVTMKAASQMYVGHQSYINADGTTDWNQIGKDIGPEILALVDPTGIYDVVKWLKEIKSCHRTSGKAHFTKSAQEWVEWENNAIKIHSDILEPLYPE